LKHIPKLQIGFKFKNFSLRFVNRNIFKFVKGKIIVVFNQVNRKRIKANQVFNKLSTMTESC
jgi:hypothetical protein